MPRQGLMQGLKQGTEVDAVGGARVGTADGMVKGTGSRELGTGKSEQRWKRLAGRVGRIVKTPKCQNANTLNAPPGRVNVMSKAEGRGLDIIGTT
jgi:hypothetical protein